MTLSSGADAWILLTQLAMAAVRTIALAGIAGMLLTALRVTTTSARLFTWTAVLYAGLSMPFLGWLLPPIPVRLPFLRSPARVGFSNANRGSVADSESAPAHRLVIQTT